MTRILTTNSKKTSNGFENTRHFLRDDDLTHFEYLDVLKLALDMSQNRLGYRLSHLTGDFENDYATGESFSIIFDKNSTRTRVSFATAISELGGNPIIIDAGFSQLSRGESIPDTANVLERMNRAIIWRTFNQRDIEDMARCSSVPVINALTDEFHPCQVLADLATFAYLGNASNLNKNGSFNMKCDYAKLSYDEKLAYISGKTVAYLGDGSNNMAHSYLLGCANAGLNINIGCPEEYAPRKEIIDDAKKIASDNGVTVSITHILEEAVKNADLVTTDAWLSMGMDKAEKSERAAAFLPFQVNTELMQKTNENALFMHCLPAYRGEEVTSEVIDGKSSVIFEEAEFRVHAQKALIYWLLKNSN